MAGDYNRTRNDEHPSFYERDCEREKDACRAALVKMPAFIEEALANEPYDNLIAAYLVGGDVRARMAAMIGDYADHCIQHALRPNNGADNIGDSLQALEDLYS